MAYQRLQPGSCQASALDRAIADTVAQLGARAGALVKFGRPSSSPPRVGDRLDQPQLVSATDGFPADWIGTLDLSASWPEGARSWRAADRRLIGFAARALTGEAVGAVVLDIDEPPPLEAVHLLCGWLSRELELSTKLGQVEAQRDRLQQGLEAADVGIWSWDFETEHVKWSPEVERIWGLARGTFDGTATTYWSSIHPDDVERLRAVVNDFITQARAGKQSPGGFHVQHRVVRPSGEVRWCDCRGYVMHAQGELVGMTGTVIDVTDQRERERQARLEEQRARLLSELTSDFVYEIDLAKDPDAPSRIVGAFERSLKLRFDDIKTRGGWLQVVHPDDRDSIQASNERLVAGHPLVREFRILDGDGEVRWMRDTARPVRDLAGHVTHIIGGVSDITDAKALQDRLDHALKLEALARLAGGVAHDFNNLLMLTYTGLDLLREETHALSKEGLQALEDIAYSAQRSGEIARSLLAFGRRQMDHPQQFDAAAMLRSMASMLRKTAGMGVRVHIVTDGGALPVRMDPGQLQLVILNLVLNARDAMPNGGELTIRAMEREFEGSDNDRPAELPPGRYITIAVQDTGTGIAPEAMRRLFEPFFTTKGATGGTGMGLATSHGTVRQAGGAVVARSLIGRGATFTVILPLANEAEGDDKPASFTRIAVGGQENLVLVEDDPHVRRVLARSLEGWGYSVAAFGSGEEALEAMLAHPEPFDLLLVDYNLPGMNGTALTRQCLARWPGLRTIVMTGFLAEDVARSGPGQVTVVSKPFTQDALAAKIRELLDA